MSKRFEDGGEKPSSSSYSASTTTTTSVCPETRLIRKSRNEIGSGKVNNTSRNNTTMNHCKTIIMNKVPVIYYICRNGQLEQPHFLEVPISSSSPNTALFLRDVITRLNYLRGPGMANSYSWSSKRSYRNGYVWQDLTDDDLILPSSGQDYVLKGSPLFHQDHHRRHNHHTSSSGHLSYETSSSSPETSPDDPICSSAEIIPPYPPFTLRPRRNHHQSRPRALVDRDERFNTKVHKQPAAVSDEIIDETAPKLSDAATQTDDERRRENGGGGRGEAMVSPTPISSCGYEDKDPPAGGGNGGEGSKCLSGRIKAPAVLMQFIKCGSVSSESIEEDRRSGCDIAGWKVQVGRLSCGAEDRDRRRRLPGVGREREKNNQVTGSGVRFILNEGVAQTAAHIRSSCNRRSKSYDANDDGD